jgi:hypothetical protein
LVEQLIRNQQVVSSSLTVGSIPATAPSRNRNQDAVFDREAARHCVNDRSFSQIEQCGGFARTKSGTRYPRIFLLRR